MNLDTKHNGERFEKIIIPSNVIDIYTRLETLLGLTLAGHSDTLTEASNWIDEIYKEAKYETNNNIESLLIHIKWNYQVIYQYKWWLKQDIR